jgi:alkylated DNA repair dioxygenase AlkB
MFGKKIVVPRKVAWFGEKEALYNYSGVLHHPIQWLLPLKYIQEKLKQEKYIESNSALCNFYRDGQDYMGWHQDNEKELGKSPVIASISLGASRRFVFREKQTKETYSIILTQGSLLIMKNGCQKQWQHSLPKMSRVKERRINLTFRANCRINF